MNMQTLMREAQKMQKELQKTQGELASSNYEGSSSCVKVVLNGNKDIISIKINSNDFDVEDIELLEDMIMMAFKDALKKVDADKEKKLGKYGQGLTGLL